MIDRKRPARRLTRREVLTLAAGAAAAAPATMTRGASGEQSAVARPAPRNLAKRGPWIDPHVHLQTAEWFSAPIFERRGRSTRRRSMPAPALSSISLPEGPRRGGPPARRYDASLSGQADRLLDEMNAAGIDIAILQAMDYDYTGQKLRVPHAEQVARLAAIRDAHPGRFILFAGIDPRRGRAGADLLERLATDHGVAGVGEFAPHFFGFPPNDRERCYPVYEKCVELNLPLSTNASIVASSVSRYCDPIYFEDVGIDFPDLNVSFTSAGLPHWRETALALAASKHNFFLDVGDWQAAVWSDPVGEVLRFVRRALDACPHRIMFGSDFPVYYSAYSERAWVEVFTVEARRHGVSFTDEELHLFFSDNAQEFIDRDLAMPPA